MTLESLVEEVNSNFRLDIIKDKGRKRDLVYAKKVFCKIAHQIGYGPTKIASVLGVDHATAHYHNKTFYVVRPNDLKLYNKIIHDNALSTTKIRSIITTEEDPVMTRIKSKLSSLHRKDLIYFEKHRVDKFMRELEREKSFELN